MVAHVVSTIVLSLLLAQQPTDSVVHPVAGPRLESVEAVTVKLRSREDLQWFFEHGFNVIDVRDGVAALTTTAEERARLDAHGFAPERVIDEPLEKGETEYHTYATLTAALQTFAEEYPEIARLTSLGQSVQGRELWVLLITDNPDVEED
jgi:hypothetical protein